MISSTDNHSLTRKAEFGQSFLYKLDMSIDVVDTLMRLYRKAQKLSIDCFVEACERRRFNVASLFIDKLIKWLLNGLVSSVLRNHLAQCCSDSDGAGN